jgi:asparagine synthase (glutamine-hydrolysing)
MCGICGKLQFRDSATVAPELVPSMLRTIAHRGPDEQGIYQSGPVALGHQRLRIIDLASGQQPMSNEDGTVWVVYNGEVYNFRELTRDLQNRGHQFKTVSDTEVLVHLYEEYGASGLSRLRGMFSFAVWDDRNRKLLLARDRVGIKPLYYRLTSESIVFASEIKAILADPAIKAEIDPLSLDRFLTYFYTPGSETVFKGIRKLEPGHYLEVTDGRVRIERYWDLEFRPTSVSLDDAVSQLQDLLAETVRDHMVSDVPVGVLLSGGVDSSAVLSFAAEHSPQPLKTFTVGFDEGCIDERPYARLAAREYGAENHEITLSPKQFWECLPAYVWHMEEPVCEPPGVALYCVSKLAREHVTVLLSGEGGDEAFAGYQSYRNFAWLERLKSWLGPLRVPFGAALSVLNHNGTARYGKYGPLMQVPLEAYYFSHSSGPYEFFNQQQDLYTDSFRNSLPTGERHEFAQQLLRQVAHLDSLSQMLYLDTKTWLPDDLLIKADKLTMAHSLELRVPLLDHRILEFAAVLPPQYKLSRWRTKHVLKKAVEKRIPSELLRRRKAGFPVPYVRWLSCDLLAAAAEVLLDPGTLSRGYFRRSAIEKLIQSAGDHNLSKEIFSLVTLELWHRAFLEHAHA